MDHCIFHPSAPQTGLDPTGMFVVSTYPSHSSCIWSKLMKKHSTHPVPCCLTHFVDSPSFVSQAHLDNLPCSHPHLPLLPPQIPSIVANTIGSASWSTPILETDPSQSKMLLPSSTSPAFPASSHCYPLSSPNIVVSSLSSS